MTSKAGRGGRRTAPYAFTGVAMLSSVLRGPRAVRVNIEIIRVFVRLMSFSALTPGNKLSIKWHGHLRRPGISRVGAGQKANLVTISVMFRFRNH